MRGGRQRRGERKDVSKQEGGEEETEARIKRRAAIKRCLNRETNRRLTAPS